MTQPLVTLSGPPGSGKTSAGRRAAKELALEYLSVGELFRAEAERHGMDLEKFSRYAESHEEVDRTLDDRWLALARPGVFLEGRLVGALSRRQGKAGLYLVVTAPAEVRYQRLAERDGIPVEVARRATELREASERDRYWRYYGIDLDREQPDLVIDSQSLGIEEVSQRVIRFVRDQGPKEPS